MKQKQTKSFINLSKFVKRFFVFDLDDKRAIMYFNSATATGEPNDVVPLGAVIAVRREDLDNSSAQLRRNNSICNSVDRRGDTSRRDKNKSIQMLSSEKPKDGWIHALEIETTKRCYRLFSDSYDVKEQWFFALNQIVLHKEYIE